MKKKSASRDAFFNLRVLVGFGLGSVAIALALVALTINTSSTAVAAGAKNQFKATLPDHADISPAMRDVEPWPVQRLEEHEAAKNPKISTGLHKDMPDLVVQKEALLHQLAPSIPEPILSFAGIPFPGVNCNCAPPDTNGEVGTTQYVQMVNTAYQVFDKATGASLFGPASIESVWSGFGGVCETGGNGDPVVVFDQIANRWVITEFAGGLTHECVAVSTSEDATGTYARYDYNLITATGLPALYDYPHFGVWPDAYYMSMNVFNTSGTAYLGPQGFAFNRVKMIAGDPTAEIIAATLLGPAFPPLLPADLDGATPPPAGAPNPFALLPDTNTYRIYHFHVDFANPGNSTFTLFGTSPAAGWTQLCPFTRSCVPELGQTSSNWLDSIGDRLMFRLAYRNFGDHESLVGNFTVDSSGIGGIRWFELRGVTGGPVATFQESTYQPDTTWRWMGSIAMDGQGNMALGYSASDATIFPQIRYTGRLAGDPLNMMTLGEGHLHDGTGAQTDTVNRWGDYSDMTVDPVDDQTFWYTQEYYDTTSSFNWRTRIGSFKLAGGGGGEANLVSAASRLTHGSAGTFEVDMPLSGTPGIEDRQSDTYNAVFTFDTAVTSGEVSVISGTATVGAITFSGNEMVAELTGVTNAEIVVLRPENVNGSGVPAAEVAFGFLTGDVNANFVVTRVDRRQIRIDRNQPVTSSNFRDDLNLTGSINGRDGEIANANRGNFIP